MIDLHCHILPGVDDGPTTLSEALEMARFCVADGITHVFATPHCHRYIHWLRAQLLPQVARFNQDLADAEIPLQVLPGSEIQVIDPAEYRREFEAGLFCHLGDGATHTLLEFSWNRALYPDGAVELVRWIRGRGMIPIVAHPERYNYFWNDPAPLEAVVAAGAWVQVTADSLLGNHGPSPQATGSEILAKYPDAVLATDGHNMKRCSGLAAGFSWVESHLGRQRSDDLRARAVSVLEAVQRSRQDSNP